MSKEKQIEEIYEVLTRDCDTSCAECKFDRLDLCLPHRKAQELYNAGYSKQRTGEWIGKTDYAGYGYYCSNCNAVFTGENAEWIAKEHYYCPKCGAKMKGGAK